MNPGGAAFQEEVAAVAELAQVCRLACEASKLEVEACSVSPVCHRGPEGGSDICKTDLTLLTVGTGNEYIKGALVLIALHLGLGSSGQQSNHWREKEESSALAVAALKYLVGRDIR